MFGWLHRFVRRRTRPIPETTAILWKRRLTLAYGLFAWNAFGLVCYSIYQGKADWAHYYGLKTDEEKNLPPAQAWAQTLGVNNARVIRISGFKKVDEYDIVDGKPVKKNQSQYTEEFSKDEEIQAKLE